ncbi:MAG: universal stress protein UspE [Psychromonas sp.]|nr:universal stress protein UspE [Psychromonas sp.]
MQKYKNILVYVDLEQETQWALARAANIIKIQQGGKITLFLCCDKLDIRPLRSVEEQSAIHLVTVKKNEEWLLALSTPYTQKNIDIQNVIVYDNHPIEAVIIEVLENGHDIIIKSTQQNYKFIDFLFTPAGCHLQRKCPSPILLVIEHDWQKKGNLLCALNSYCMNDSGAVLNNLIIDEAKSLASIFNFNIHLVNAYPITPISLALNAPGFHPIEYCHKLKLEHQKILLEYANKYEIPDQNIHLHQGNPEDVISDTAKEINADLVIIGSQGHPGLIGYILGHTCEQVLDDLHCDLLTLHSKDFESSIKP